MKHVKPTVTTVSNQTESTQIGSSVPILDLRAPVASIVNPAMPVRKFQGTSSFKYSFFFFVIGRKRVLSENQNRFFRMMMDVLSRRTKIPGCLPTSAKPAVIAMLYSGAGEDNHCVFASHFYETTRQDEEERVRVSIVDLRTGVTTGTHYQKMVAELFSH